MPRARKDQVSLDTTPYYHIMSRCVRRSFLCGYDKVARKDYSHRQGCIEERIRLIASLFAIDLCSYAILSNHYHLVIKLAPEQARAWDDREVALRWTQVYKGPELVRRWLNGMELPPFQEQTVKDIIHQYRKRLQDLGWFMKSINEPIARQANDEDGCSGHFFEARYKSQALPSDQALLSCLAYVDLNPVRANIAQTPETSEHTSIKERIKPQFDLHKAVQSQIEKGYLQSFEVPLKPLLHFGGNEYGTDQIGLPMSLQDYLELVDTTGRIVRDDKNGAIDDQLPPILNRLTMDFDEWLENVTRFEALYCRKFGRRRKQNVAGFG